MRSRWASLVMGLLLMAACASEGSTTSGPARIPSGSQGVVVLAIGHLARQLGIDAGLVAVAQVEAVDWPDTSLGCPQPDMAYAQVITPGYRIRLSAQGQTYEYHSDRTSRVVPCPPP